MGQQFKLEELYLNNCRSLKNVQSNLFNGLQSLKELQPNDCSNIFEVIDHINITLSSLSSLSIEGITVESLPSSIKQFSNLQYLKLNKCTRLQSLPQLPQSLIKLDAIGCSALKRVRYTSTDVRPFRYKRNSFTSFLNCMELDEHSVKFILAYFLLLLNKLLLERYSWYFLNHDYMVEIITNKSVDEAEAEAIIADDKDPKNLIKTFYFRKNVNNFTSNHVFLWYDDDLSYKLQHEVKKSGVAKSKILFKLKIVPQFGHERRSSRKHLEVIKECGVCPTNYFKFQNFIHELEVESEASASGMGVGSSYHQCKDEEEAIAPIQKSKGFIFSPFPTTS
ncbi:disease resistance-like protein DSC1 [Senna tora]|uniref:Disease resistance-like protein DSC1 n=2 Tax=Senna tora TaxID=362788 RepID=A0A834T2H7_9FABA|nr:disease resistance-like protein DSC1 [Senna tora]